jgi:hypothetical protein
VVAMWSGQAVVCMWLGGCVGIGMKEGDMWVEGG